MRPVESAMARKRNEQSTTSRDESRLPSLIDNATTSPDNALDVALIASIKQLVRQSDENVRLAFSSLMEKLKYKHSQVRYLTVLVIDELFTRSKLFRTLLVKDFEKFILLSVGYRTDFPLPPPANRATALKAKSMEILEKWNDNFGPHYKPLRLGYEYLKNTLRLQFPNLRQAAEQAAQQRKEREARSRALALEKYEVLKKEFPNISAEIDQTLNQLDECFQILSYSRKTDHVDNRHEIYMNGRINDDDDDDDDYEDYDLHPLRQVLEKAASQPGLVHETQENKPIFNATRDLLKIIENQHLPTVQEWLSLLMRVDTQDSDTQGRLLRGAIDLRNKLSSMKTKCTDLGIDSHQQSKTGDEEDDDIDDIIWEEGDSTVEEASKSCVSEQVQNKAKEPISNNQGSNLEGQHCRQKCSQKAKVEETITERQSQVNVGISMKTLSDKNVTEEANSKSNGVKEELLKEAPLLPWGSYLDRWGSEHNVPINSRGLLLESHWGKVDFDALLPANKVAEMSMRTSYYKPETREITPCLAPLRNGGLCQRRDLRVCPLHGPIRPSDINGNPIITGSDSKTKSEEDAAIVSKIKPGNKLSLEAIAAKAVANVRAQDAIELNKKIERRLQAKRNREHNAAVLREAALANTHQGLGEALGEDLEGYNPTTSTLEKHRKKRAMSSLKAMLHPKPSAKDRLAERLLNNRANDANTHAIIQEEDSVYRESFVNRW